MENDAIPVSDLENNDLDQLEGEVKAAFQNYKEWLTKGVASAVVETRLANGPIGVLLTDCLLAGEKPPLKIHEQMTGIEALLYWAAAQIRPPGDFEPTMAAWRRYFSLYEFYLCGKLGREVASKLKIEEDANLYRYVDQAVKEVAVLLKRELASQANADERRWYLIDRCYQSEELSKEDKLILRLAAVLPCDIPRPAFIKLTKDCSINNAKGRIQKLLKARLLTQVEPESIQVHRDARTYLISISEIEDSPAVRKRWYQETAKYFVGQGYYAEAIYQQLHIEDFDAVAEILIENYDEFIEEGKVDLFYHLVNKIRLGTVSDKTWANLKIATGDAAMLIKDTDIALQEYGQALDIQDLYLQALAYHRRAEAFLLVNVDESETHYEFIISKLEQNIEHSAKQDNQLKFALFDMYIDFAWVYLQEKPNQVKGEAILKKAKTMSLPEDSRRLTNLHDALATLARVKVKNEDWEEYIDLALKARMYATVTRDVKLRMKTAHNVGMGYIWDEEPTLGLKYLQEASMLAQQIDDLPNQGKIDKMIGACYFLIGDYHQAVEYYHKAYKLLAEAGFHTWLGLTCHDLAEAYAELGDKVEARRYYEEAKKIYTEVKDQELKQILETLFEKYETILKSLPTKLEEIIDYVRQHGTITQSETRGISGVSASTARRRLNKLIEFGLLELRRDGPNSFYVFKGS